MVYVPEFSQGNCAYIYNSDVIRVYDSVPSHNSTISYTDYYYNSHYLFNTGSTTFNNYSNLPTCLSSDVITTDVYYRNDLPDILIIFIILCFVCFVVPWKIFTRMFRRYQ